MGQVRTHRGGSSARSLARRLGLPAARGAAAGALAVTVVIGSGATASAGAGLPGGPVAPHPDGQVGWDGGDAAPSAGARLAAMGEHLSRARLDDALAIGRAALDAADASRALVGGTPSADGLTTSVEALRAAVRTHEGTVVRSRAGAGSTVLPEAVTPPPSLTTVERLTAAEQIAALAADVFRVALQVEATAAATAAPGLPGLDAPPLQLTAPRSLEALAAPAPEADAPVSAAPSTAPVAPAPAPAIGTTGGPVGTGDAATAPAAPAAPADPATPADPAVPADPAAPADPTAPVDPAAGPDAAVAPTEGADGAAAPASALPAELADGLADLEAAVAAASGAAGTELLTLEELPVLPSALGAASVGRWSSFLPDTWTALGLENGRIPEALLCAPDFAPAFLLRCDAAAALEAVNEAYRADFGEDLVVTSGYRSFDQQAGLRVAKGWLAAPAGRSNHGLGVAVDLGGFGGLGQFDSPRYRWMVANGERFGWVHPEAMRPGGGGPPEPWHFEFGTE